MAVARLPKGRDGLAERRLCLGVAVQSDEHGSPLRLAHGQTVGAAGLLVELDGAVDVGQGFVVATEGVIDFGRHALEHIRTGLSACWARAIPFCIYCSASCGCPPAM